ncbi:MAG TPA: dihydroorotase [Solimonas sp.]
MSRKPRETAPDWSAAARRKPATEPGDGSLLIVGARVLDPASGLDGTANLGIRDGRIDHVGKERPAGRYARTLEANGQWLMPGLVDLCARFREPGQTHKANFASETAAAQAGGITAVLIPPDTQPVVDTPAMLMRLQRIARGAGGLDVHLLGALTRGLQGEALAELSALKTAGAIGLSNGLVPLRDALIARRALDYARGLKLTTHVFAQDGVLAAGGCAHEGPVATRLGLSPIPSAAEVAAIRTWITLVEDTGAAVHFCRLSTARGAGLVESAQKRGLPVTADVAAHQLFLTADDVDGFDARCHLIPPLRAAEDRDALRAAVRKGVIGAICSDHQPHEADAKINPFPLTEPGASALETLLPLTLALVRDGVLTPLQAAQRLSLGPARIASVDGGRLAKGAAAHLVLVDADAEWLLHPERLRSAGRNTPFAGRRLQGRVTRCLHAGLEVFAAD